MTNTPFTVLPAGGDTWQHPRLRLFAVLLRLCGYLGPLPRWAVMTCVCVYPDVVCPCGSYKVDWKGDEYAGEE